MHSVRDERGAYLGWKPLGQHGFSLAPGRAGHAACLKGMLHLRAQQLHQWHQPCSSACTLQICPSAHILHCVSGTAPARADCSLQDQLQRFQQHHWKCISAFMRTFPEVWTSAVKVSYEIHQHGARGEGSLEAGPTNSDGSCLTISAYAGVAWGMLNCSLCTQRASVTIQSSAAESAPDQPSLTSLSLAIERRRSCCTKSESP